MSTPERVRTLVEPLVADLALDLYDLEYSGGVLRVMVSQPGGVGMDAITALTKAISRAIDDQDPIPSGFTLEVSSPGLERPLRTPAHFLGAIGTTISVKTLAGTGGPRRLTGVLEAADDHAITVVADDPAGESHQVAYDKIERARTVFVWGPTPKPGKAPNPTRAKAPGKATKAPGNASKTAEPLPNQSSEPVSSSPPNEEKVPAS